MEVCCADRKLDRRQFAHRLHTRCKLALIPQYYKYVLQLDHTDRGWCRELADARMPISEGAGSDGRPEGIGSSPLCGYGVWAIVRNFHPDVRYNRSVTSTP